MKNKVTIKKKALVVVILIVCGGSVILALNREGIALFAFSTRMTSVPTYTFTPIFITNTRIALPVAQTPTYGTVTKVDSSIHDFNISNSNQVSVDDILDEVIHYGEPYGGFRSSCGLDTFDANKLTLSFSNDGNRQYSLMDTIQDEICGGSPGEKLKITIIYPDGHQKTWEEKLSVDNHIFIFNYKIDLDAPIGIYTILIQDGKSMVVFHPVVIKPTGPRLYHINSKWIFYNFSSKEKIRVVAFRGNEACRTKHHAKCIYTPLYWQTFNADEGGQLVISSNADSLSGIGEYVGAVTDRDFDDEIFCPEIPQKLNIEPGEWVVVVDKRAWTASYSNSDRLGSSRKIYIPKGTVFRVGGYKVSKICQSKGKSDVNYLRIYCDGMEYCGKYIPEGIGDRYFVRSVSKPDNGVFTSCGGAPKPRLQIGQYAVIIGQVFFNYIEIPKGTNVKVIAGPVCDDESYNADGWSFKWFVQTDYGFNDWVSEGYTTYSGESSYNLEPTP